MPFDADATIVKAAVNLPPITGDWMPDSNFAESSRVGSGPLSRSVTGNFTCVLQFYRHQERDIDDIESQLQDIPAPKTPKMRYSRTPVFPLALPSEEMPTNALVAGELVGDIGFIRKRLLVSCWGL